MSELDRVQQNLNNLVKAKLKINPGLEAVERKEEYSDMINFMYGGFSVQLRKLLKDGVLDEIDAVIGKAERIYTDDDLIEIEEMVRMKLLPVGSIEQDDKIVEDLLTDFMVLVFTFGGQDFLNKHNIPATFNLTNESIKNNIIRTGQAVLKGVDETTTKWVTKQIYNGKQKGLANTEIADSIRDKIPETYSGRADAVVRTETARMVGEAEAETAVRNGASHKQWVTVSDGRVCPICDANQAQGQIGIKQIFQSGALQEPAHPNCRCLVEYVFTPFQGTVWSGQ